MGWRREALKGIFITLRSLCRRDYLYNTPHGPIERLTENEYLKFCHWSKEQDQLEKDIINAYRWVCNSTTIEDWELNRDIMQLFTDRWCRVTRMIQHLSLKFAEKYGRSPTIPSIIEKNGFVRQSKPALNNNEDISIRDTGQVGPIPTFDDSSENEEVIDDQD